MGSAEHAVKRARAALGMKGAEQQLGEDAGATTFMIGTNLSSPPRGSSPLSGR